LRSAIPGENEDDEFLFLVSLDAFHDKTGGHRLNSTGCALPLRRVLVARSKRAFPPCAVKIPNSFGSQLNLARLYRVVCARGGYDNVRPSRRARRPC
jgi:hypothetical protein